MTLAALRVGLRLGQASVLEDVSIEVVPGTLTALIGPNGAGKSSLVRVLSGELAPTAGAVRLGGVSLDRLGAVEQALRRSVMTQSADVVVDFQVEEILRMGWVHGGREQLNASLGELAQACAIRHLLGRRFRTLSGGERQRVQFARALLQVWSGGESGASRYLLLDEPTSSLDLAHEQLALRLASRAAQRRIGVLAVLHDLNLAARFADRAVLLSGGKVAASGPPCAVFRDRRLTDAYGTPIRVERHEALKRLVVHTLSVSA